MTLQTDLDLMRPLSNERQATVLGIVLTGEMLGKAGDRVLRPFGLTDSQFNVLMLLKYQAGPKPISQTRLGRMLLVNRSNVTGLIDRMEQAGWVRREAEGGDRRVKLVAITSEGRALLARAEKAYFHAIDDVMAGLSEKDRERLVALLDTVRDRLCEIVEP